MVSETISGFSESPVYLMGFIEEKPVKCCLYPYIFIHFPFLGAFTFYVSSDVVFINSLKCLSKIFLPSHLAPGGACTHLFFPRMWASCLTYTLSSLRVLVQEMSLIFYLSSCYLIARMIFFQPCTSLELKLKPFLPI